MTLKLGSHVSMSGGLIGAAKEASKYDADTFMIEHGLSDIVVHPGAFTDKDAPYGIGRIIDALNDIDGVFAEFDRIISLERLKVFHINGSLNARGAKKDRHANLGAGGDDNA